MKLIGEEKNGIKFARLLGVAAALLVSGVSVQANLIQNGGFEDVGRTGLPLFDGWNATGGAHVVDASRSGVSAAEGSHFVDLNGLGSISSAKIATTPGAHYTLTFDFGSCDNYGNLSTVAVGINSFLGNYYSIRSNGSETWKTFTYDFTAQSCQTVITFQGLDFSCWGWSGVDYCRLDEDSGKAGGQTTAVPEVGTVMAGLLLVFPLAMSAARILRRRR